MLLYLQGECASEWFWTISANPVPWSLCGSLLRTPPSCLPSTTVEDLLCWSLAQFCHCHLCINRSLHPPHPPHSILLHRKCCRHHTSVRGINLTCLTEVLILQVCPRHVTLIWYDLIRHYYLLGSRYVVQNSIVLFYESDK